MFKLRTIITLVVLFLIGRAGFNVYQYFFDKNAPELIVSGIKDGAYYAGDISCIVNGSHSYKVGKISVFLDETPLIYNFSIGKQSCEHPFSINTRALTYGKHKLSIKLVDGTYQKNCVERSYMFFVDNVPLQAAFTSSESEIKVFQGRVLHLQFQASKFLKEAKVNIFSQEVPCFAEAKNSTIYEAFVPVECEQAPNEYLFQINCLDNVDNAITLEGKVQVVPYPFKKQKLLKISEDKVEREKAAYISQKELDEKLKNLVLISPQHKLWHGPFIVPFDATAITSEFGTVRTTPTRGIYRHKGIDLTGQIKGTVWAPHDGVVIEKDRYAFSGNTVVIDHGCGVFSLLFHLDSFASDIEIGQKIKKGSPVGKMGMTGFADGYHLHWEMRVNNISVDPMEWTKTIW